MSTQSIVESISTPRSPHRSPATQIERFDRLISEAETRLVEQEAYVREVSVVSGSTAVASFELQKMHLLIALLREGRARLASNGRARGAAPEDVMVAARHREASGGPAEPRNEAHAPSSDGSAR